MKTFRKFFGILAAVLSFFAVSCSLFGDEEPSEERNFVEPALTASVRGSVAVSGAAPGVFRKSSARTALPSLNGVSYSVEASDGGRTYVAEVDAENLSFSFGELAVVEGGTEYTIKATGTVSGIEVVSGSCTVTLRPGDAFFCEVPVKPDMKSGTGSVSLEIDVGGTEIKSCAIELDGGSVSSCPVDSGGKILFEKTLDSGCYDAVFSFYSTADSSSADGVLLYEFRESVHVCKSLVTDSWFGSSAYIADGKCEITKALVDKFALSRIYVSSRKEDSKETGTRAEPYKSVARAMNALLDKDTDYTILVDGELAGAQEIPSAITTAKARSITIQGANGLDAGGMPKDSLNGKNEGTTLKISSSVPVTIKNLKITGGKNASGTGGGIYNNGTLILKGKNIIYDNKDSNGKQSNVYLPYGKKIKIDGDISGSKICVSMAFTDTNKPTVAAPATFTEDYGYGTTNASRPGAVFISDNEYAIGTTDSNEAAFMISGGSFYTPRDYDFTLSCTDSLGNSAACLYTGVAATFTVTPTVTRKETSGTPTPLYYNHADKKLYTNTGLTLTDCDETVSWAASLYCAGTKVTDITPSDVTGGIGITIPAIAYEYTYTLKVNASYLGETYDAEWDLVCANIIGTKPKPTAVGDIVFTDGSAMAYSEISTITNDQKAAAIAVIFYVGTDCSNDGSSQTLGVGLVHNKSGLAWCTSSANAHSKDITTIQCTPSGSTGPYTFTGDKNGSDNFEQLAAFSGVSDTATESKYPAFYFTKNYKDQTGSNVSGTDYESDWYLPTICELFYIWKNKSTVDAVSELCGGSKFGNSGWYWSSSQLVSTASHAYLFNLSGFWQYGDKTTTSNAQGIISSVCAIRAFD
ncbi:DUF1566 domain-containing protein [Treponema saccharophilum]|uniref:DUF1566 domain-containing protein n=1 Tax=Treponema saccharophilum DSM 2985 TaxID=907348 RepID=H7EJ00_9SPIR|nr:DUF1566 domain-containing protein [Treponema saccharophilum]EIC02457.1 hypothetical protein TresaDRAFT_2099 [Treponema saccharophilum DSM 2985]BDC96637.1 hypothetical protein TRSA_17360 [Treponema saccharophilum]